MTTEHPVNLDGLLGHLSVSSGLYSRQTFVSLYSCIVRLIRQYQLKGLIFYRFNGDADFETLTLALDGRSDLTLIPLDDAVMTRLAGSRADHQGLVVALTNQFCATVYWSDEGEPTYSMLDGGWTFHPGDSKTVALQVARAIDAINTDNVDATSAGTSMTACVEATALDRRYDEKITGFITQLVNNLETRNRELSLALNQVQQLNARVLDSERLAAIGQLCSVIAHEIRNPLGLIDLYAKLIEKQVDGLETDGDKAPLEKNLGLIRSATQNLEAILSELTSYSRPLTLDLETIDLRTVTLEVVDMFLPRYEEKGVGLKCHVPDDMVLSTVDERRIKQALINLVKNALEASKPETTVEVVLAPRRGDERVFIKVADQGSGVDERSRAKLFTPYFSTKGNGTGLGLAHSRKILQAHGGTVDLLKTGEDGSTFALILPRYNPATGEPTAQGGDLR